MRINSKDNRKTISTVELLIIIDSVLVLAFLVVFLLYSKNGKADSNCNGAMSFDTRAETKTEVQNNPLDGRTVELAGFDNMVLRQGQAIYLSNVKDNDDFLIKYEVYNDETKEETFSTDLIRAGEGVNWVASNDLEPGVYQIAFRQSPFWQNPDTEEYIPLTGGTNIVEIEVLGD